MERYVAITSVSNKMYNLVEINSDTLQIVRNVTVDDNSILYAVSGCRPINFSIRAGVVVDSTGSFDRLKIRAGVTPHIVVQELATSVGTIVGYRLLNPYNFNIIALKKEDIIARQSKSDVPLLQNGIIRGNKVNCYKYSKFPRYVIGTKTRTATKKHKNVVDRNMSTSETNEFLSKFSPEQRRELSLAKKDGVPIRLIANPDLSPKQMRVLWVSKKNGAYSEYFSSPKYSEEVMKFYADRLITQQMVRECSDLLSRPDYGVDKLTELYLAVCEGIDYSSFIDADTAEEMYVERERLRKNLWGSSLTMSGDYINDAVKFAEKLKRG